MDEVENTGRTAQYDDDEKYADYDPYANFYDYDTDEEDEDDDEEENDGDGLGNEFSGEDDYGGAGDYGVVGDDEEDTEGNEDEEGSENPDAQADNEGEGNASPDGKQSDKESLAKTYKDKRLTFSDIVFLWSKLEKNPTTKSMLVPINSAVREGLGAGTAGFSYLITLIKPKYPVKPVQALLELADSPMGNILMSPKALIETVFNLPPVKKLVIQALEILDKAEKPTGGSDDRNQNKTENKSTHRKSEDSRQTSKPNANTQNWSGFGMTSGNSNNADGKTSAKNNSKNSNSDSARSSGITSGGSSASTNGSGSSNGNSSSSGSSSS